jgi:hypothetical protein
VRLTSQCRILSCVQEPVEGMNIKSVLVRIQNTSFSLRDEETDVLAAKITKRCNLLNKNVLITQTKQSVSYVSDVFLSQN